MQNPPSPAAGPTNTSPKRKAPPASLQSLISPRSKSHSHGEDFSDLSMTSERENHHPLRVKEISDRLKSASNTPTLYKMPSRSSFSAAHSPMSNAAHSRHLITVIPPSHLPHDPPHPRTSSFCSGYGPPQNFSRGVLIPLYPTLSGQLAAVAREYGLPSIAGIVLYLLDISSELIDSGMHQAFVGGPRISDEAWALLWERLFEAEASERQSRAALSDEEDFDETDSIYWSANKKRAPPVPPIPLAHALASSARSTNVMEEEASLQHSLSDHSSRNSDHLELEDSAVEPDLASTNTSYSITRKMESSRSPPLSASRPQSAASRRMDKTYHTTSTYPNKSRHFAQRSSTSHSARSGRAPSLASSNYSSSVIVGKVEFDIDRRRGASRWFDNWMEAASQIPQSSVNGTPSLSSPSSPGQNSVSIAPLERSSSIASAPEGLMERRRSSLSQLNSSLRYPSENTSSPVRSAKQELCLPSIIGIRHGNPMPIEQETEPITAEANERFPPTVASKSDQELDAIAEDHEVTELYQPLPDRDDNDKDSEASESEYEDEAEVENEATGAVTDSQREIRSEDANAESSTETAFVNTPDTQRDPLKDVFGPEEWPSFPVKELGPSTTGLGITSTDSVPTSDGAPDEPVDDELPPQDDVKDVLSLFKKRREGLATGLSSPIQLESSKFATTDLNALEVQPDATTSPGAQNFDPPIITRQSPSIASNSRATSYLGRSPDSTNSLSDLATNEPSPAAHVWNQPLTNFGTLTLKDSGIPEEDETQPASKTDESHMDSTTSLSDKTPEMPSVDAMSARASLDMFDDIEKALAELSPANKKVSPRSPSGQNRFALAASQIALPASPSIASTPKASFNGLRDAIASPRPSQQPLGTPRPVRSTSATHSALSAALHQEAGTEAARLPSTLSRQPESPLRSSSMASTNAGSSLPIASPPLVENSSLSYLNSPPLASPASPPTDALQMDNDMSLRVDSLPALPVSDLERPHVVAHSSTEDSVRSEPDLSATQQDLKTRAGFRIAKPWGHRSEQGKAKSPTMSTSEAEGELNSMPSPTLSTSSASSTFFNKQPFKFWRNKSTETIPSPVISAPTSPLLPTLFDGTPASSSALPPLPPRKSSASYLPEIDEGHLSPALHSSTQLTSPETPQLLSPTLSSTSDSTIASRRRALTVSSQPAEAGLDKTLMPVASNIADDQKMLRPARTAQDYYDSDSSDILGPTSDDEDLR